MEINSGRPILIADQLEEIDKRVRAILAEREALIKDTVAGCRHPWEAIYELPYKPHEWLQSERPWLICSLCGLTEEGWGCGYKKLRHAEHKDLLIISRDRWNKMRTITVSQGRESHNG
jgi:hypothetical protein